MGLVDMQVSSAAKLTISGDRQAAERQARDKISAHVLAQEQKRRTANADKTAKLRGLRLAREAEFGASALNPSRAETVPRTITPAEELPSGAAIRLADEAAGIGPDDQTAAVEGMASSQDWANAERARPDMPGETADGLDDLAEEVRRRAEELPLRKRGTF